MTNSSCDQSSFKNAYMLQINQMESLLIHLQNLGYSCVGPTIQDGAIVYDTLKDVSDFPQGWTEIQDAGVYRVKRRKDKALFGYTVGPHSWKKFLFPSRQKLWSANKTDDGFEIFPDESENVSYALIGVRSCDLHALNIHDRVFDNGSFKDTGYTKKRQQAFIVAVQCVEAGATCFCVSMKTGPRSDKGFDLALTEMITSEKHQFLVEVGSPRGDAIVKNLELPLASQSDIEYGNTLNEQASSQMTRVLDTQKLKETLYKNYDHKHWDEVANRCLSCANCTLVCPTCFCSDVGDVTDLTGEHVERWRSWGSCFTSDFTYIHGGSVRNNTKSKYRQWLTHKLATWIDQFDTSGCVGCGRCITWCPVGIDLTKEVEALRKSEDCEEN